MAQLDPHITQALRDALAQAVPDTPSGQHRILVVGQIVVHVHHPQDQERGGR